MENVIQISHFRRPLNLTQPSIPLEVRQRALDGVRMNTGRNPKLKQRPLSERMAELAEFERNVAEKEASRQTAAIIPINENTPAMA